jgi:DNA-binding GntR family transcriptional regulator
MVIRGGAWDGAQSRETATRNEVADRLADTTAERVADRLRQDILHAVFVPGSRIKLADIAERYTISLMPVREALRQLASEGLVDLLPKKRGT